MWETVAEAAESSGLPLYPVHFELVDTPHLNALAAYGGLPVRYAYWGFGKSWGRFKVTQDYRRGQIYELVINHRPAIAFLDRNMVPARALLVLAHVLAHVYFFRHHRLFAGSMQDAVARMGRHRRVIASLTRSEGEAAVEEFLDAALMVADFVGDSSYLTRLGGEASDVLGFLYAAAPSLQAWQREILAMLHEEARYFWPQIITKVTNEGFATFWHHRIMQSIPMNARDAWETARMHAEVIARQPEQMNPYALGFCLMQKIDHSRGIDGVLAQSSAMDDVDLVRTYLDEVICQRLQLGLFGNQDNQRTEPASWEELKRQLVVDLDHGGIPRVVVEQQKTANHGTLYLKHRHDGRDLDFAALPKVLEQLACKLWGGPVVLSTVRQKVPRAVFHDGHAWSEHLVTDLTSASL